jgi:hypothetical protein
MTQTPKRPNPTAATLTPNSETLPSPDANLLLLAQQTRQTLLTAAAPQTPGNPTPNAHLPLLSPQESALLTPLTNLPPPVTPAEAARAQPPAYPPNRPPTTA